MAAHLEMSFEESVDARRTPVGTAARRAPHLAGFSLIEVLVVMLILSFGMLGIAGLQANTAKYKVNSWARSSASIQFSDLADRMRANPSQTGQTFTANGSATSTSAYMLTDGWAAQQSANLTPAVNCLTAACTAVDRASYDMLVWRDNVRRLFPQGAAVVAGNRSAGVRASVAWFDRQFVKTDGTLDSSTVCTAAIVAAGGAGQSNCCPMALGDPAVPGVRCTNVSFLP